jgi:hypothetical protein
MARPSEEFQQLPGYAASPRYSEPHESVSLTYKIGNISDDDDDDGQQGERRESTNRWFLAC